MRRRGTPAARRLGDSVSSDDDNEPEYLSVSEQREIVERFERDAKRADGMHRLAFGLLSLPAAGLMLFSVYSMYQDPWRQKWHYFLRGNPFCSAPLLMLTEIASAVVYLMAGYFLQVTRGRDEDLLKRAWAAAMLIAGYWTSMYLIGSMVTESVFFAYGPLAYCLLMRYLQESIKESADQVTALQKLMYKHKKV